MRRVTAVSFAATILLAGCSQTAAEALLDEQRGADDVLPDSIDAETYGYDEESVHLLVEHDGVSYFLARSTEELLHQVCVVAYPESGDWIGSCFQDGRHSETYGSGVGAFRFVGEPMSDADVPEGWVRVHPNLLVSEGSL